MTYTIETTINENSEFIGTFSSKVFSAIYDAIYDNSKFFDQFDIYEDGKWIGNQDDIDILEYYGYEVTSANIKNKLITIE
jgi:hypothetical protein